MEDVRLGRKMRYATGFASPTVAGGPLAIFPRRSGRISIVVTCAVAGLTLQVPTTGTGAAYISFWTSTAAQLSVCFTIEQLGQAILGEIFVGAAPGEGVMSGLETWQDEQ